MSKYGNTDPLMIMIFVCSVIPYCVINIFFKSLTYIPKEERNKVINLMYQEYLSGYIFPGSQIREKKNKTNYRTLSI